MTASAVVSVPGTSTGNGAAPDLLGRLAGVCRGRDLADLGERLADLTDLVRDDMRDVSHALARLPRGATGVERSAAHLLDLGGKRLRPMCVALAARLGSGFGPRARELAVAAELVHCATLLHDDVVDVGDMRRGQPAARTVYGNAASIFAGDWLLVEALRRVRGARVPGVLDRLLLTIEEMILAEAIQLENRGRIDAGRDGYFRVVRGKTAALFRWAMDAGGRAAALDDDACDALSAYGLHLGVAFQLVDDLLDVAGDVRATGKELFADLREGKVTYPLILALEADPTLGDALARFLAAPDDLGRLPARRLLAAMSDPGVVQATRDLAADHARRAVASLAVLPDGRARDALVTVAGATVRRET